MDMAGNNCANCNLRKKHEKNPKSIAGRFWRWHINFCPGWKKYCLSISDEERAEIASKYNFNKYSKVEK
jgi:hypothetical protein